MFPSMTNKQRQKILLLCTGVFIFNSFIYIRFLRERLLRDIPFQLSFYSFIILVFICIIYVYLLYSTIKPKAKTNIVIDILAILKQPLYAVIILHEFLIGKNAVKITFYYILKFYISLTNQKYYDHYEDYTYNMIFILPKVIFVTCLIIDCFIYETLYIIYSCAFMLIIPLILKYLLFCAPTIIEYYCNLFNESFITEITSEDIIRKPEDYDEEGFLIKGKPFYDFDPSTLEYDDDITLESGAIRYKYLHAQKLIHHLSWTKRFKTQGTLTYEYKILTFDERKDVIMLNPHKKAAMTKKQANNLLNNLINIDVLKHYVDVHATHYDTPITSTKKINIFIYLLSFICWAYILIKSLHTLPENFILLFLPAEDNPFSHSFILGEIYDKITARFK